MITAKAAVATTKPLFGSRANAVTPRLRQHPASIGRKPNEGATAWIARGPRRRLMSGRDDCNARASGDLLEQF
jgi:hypothetical protein